MQDLYHQRDFFSVTAILRGLSDGGVEIEPGLAGFLDDGHNYRTYRFNLHQEPCLPFIYTFIKEFKRGNSEAGAGDL
jgi:hypothetical protein